MNDATIQQVNWREHRKTLLSIRFEVFVREQGVPRELEEDEQDPAATHFLVLSGKLEPVATARLLPDGQLGRMAVRRPYRRQGIGSDLLRHMLRFARREGILAVFLNAQCNAIHFYERHGFIPQGGTFDDAGIPHQRMCLRF